MGAGMICHKDHILNHLCYSANVGDLIRQGFLSPLRTIRGNVELDLAGVTKSAGEFNQKQLAERVDRGDVVAQAVNHMVACVRAENRKSIIVFCINVEHCKHVAAELVKYGIEAPWIIGSTSMDKRERLVRDFKEGRLQWLLSVDCFFEGFNAPRADCMGMLRPTHSKGRWIQAVGRLLRLFPGKDFGLVLDYGQNIDRHGPIDLEEGEEVRLATCGKCANEFSRAVKACPSGGEPIPLKQADLFRQETEQRERVREMHTAVASVGVLLNEPRTLSVDRVSVRLHSKAGSPDSLRVTYHCGISQVNEWICIDHTGFAGKKSRAWLRERGIDCPSVADAMARHTEIEADLTEVTESVQVKYEGKYLRVMGYGLKERVGT
jgi:DNA repair protein RadD